MGVGFPGVRDEYISRSDLGSAIFIISDGSVCHEMR